MIILKVWYLKYQLDFYLHLNSNMIILKVKSSPDAVAKSKIFKFQYDNT